MQLITQSDLVTKLILLILLILSIVAWTLFIYKLAIGYVKRRHVNAALQALKSTHTVDEISSVAAHHAHTVPGVLIARNLSILRMILDRRQTITPLTEREMQMLESGLEQTISEAMQGEESFLPFFAATAAVSPLLGLFGTVWGLIHAFIRISEKQQADIPTVAPGIAEALITTLAGLMVAIPALLMFHYLSTRARAYEQQLLAIGDKLLWSCTMLFLN